MFCFHLSQPLGNPFIHVSTLDWCFIRCMGEKVIPFVDRILHLFANSTVENEPMVRQHCYALRCKLTN